MRQLLAHLYRLPTWILVGIVRSYQIFISPLLGCHCRFRPTCSQYFVEAVQKYGVVSGTIRGVWRVCRCQPFSHGGEDPP